MKQALGYLLRALRRLPGPTGAAIFYLLLIALVVVQSHREQDPAVQNLLILIAASVAAFVLSSAVVGFSALGSISVRRVLPPHAMTGLPVAIGIVVENRGWLPRGVIEVRHPEVPHVGFRHSADVSVYLPAKQSERLDVTAVFLRRGEQELEGLVLTTAFPFGLLRYWRSVNIKDRVLVWPRPIGLPAALKARLASGSIGEHAARRRGSDEVYGLREYSAGDPVSRIHWPTSARAGQPMLLELEGFRGPRCMVLLDVSEDGEAPSLREDSKKEEESSLDSSDVESPVARGATATRHGDCESLFSLAAGLLLDLEREGRASGLALMDGENLVRIPPESGHAQRSLKMAALARAKPATVPLEDWADAVIHELPKDCATVLITARAASAIRWASKSVLVVSLADPLVRNAIEASRLPARRPSTSRWGVDESPTKEETT